MKQIPSAPFLEAEPYRLDNHFDKIKKIVYRRARQVSCAAAEGTGSAGACPPPYRKDHASTSSARTDLNHLQLPTPFALSLSKGSWDLNHLQLPTPFALSLSKGSWDLNHLQLPTPFALSLSKGSCRLFVCYVTLEVLMPFRWDAKEHVAQGRYFLKWLAII